MKFTTALPLALALAHPALSLSDATPAYMGFTLADASSPLRAGLQARQSSCSDFGDYKVCGDGCVPFSYTCCPDERGGCETAIEYCSLASNGKYGCCPRGERCRGPAGDVDTILPTSTSRPGDDDDDDDFEDDDDKMTTAQPTPTSSFDDDGDDFDDGFDSDTPSYRGTQWNTPTPSPDDDDDDDNDSDTGFLNGDSPGTAPSLNEGGILLQALMAGLAALRMVL